MQRRDMRKEFLDAFICHQPRTIRPSDRQTVSRRGPHCTAELEASPQRVPGIYTAELGLPPQSVRGIVFEEFRCEAETWAMNPLVPSIFRSTARPSDRQTAGPSLPPTGSLR